MNTNILNKLTLVLDKYKYEKITNLEEFKEIFKIVIDEFINDYENNDEIYIKGQLQSFYESYKNGLTLINSKIDDSIVMEDIINKDFLDLQDQIHKENPEKIYKICKSISEKYYPQS